jgi:YD repeat-containing protein
MNKLTTSDGLGRTIRVTVMDASSTVYTKVDTEYDGLGRVSEKSLPYTGSSASYWTQTLYDGLGRGTKVIPADGSSSSDNIAYSYSGNTVIKTDETGKQTKSKIDALGRQIEVDEPDPSNSNTLTLATTYTYDPMNNLTQVSQGSQTRTYVFDGMSRKTSETTPEAGTVSYQYNNYGKMTQRTDARGVVTTYTYGTSLNRLTQISYNVSGASGVPSTPTVSYLYGTYPTSYNNGRLVQMTDGLGTEDYAYDQLGRQTQSRKLFTMWIIPPALLIIWRTRLTQ